MSIIQPALYYGPAAPFFECWEQRKSNMNREKVKENVEEKSKNCKYKKSSGCDV